jgi:hypothetical protein
MSSVGVASTVSRSMTAQVGMRIVVAKMISSGRDIGMALRIVAILRTRSKGLRHCAVDLASSSKCTYSGGGCALEKIDSFVDSPSIKLQPAQLAVPSIFKTLHLVDMSHCSHSYTSRKMPISGLTQYGYRCSASSGRAVVYNVHILLYMTNVPVGIVFISS